MKQIIIVLIILAFLGVAQMKKDEKPKLPASDIIDEALKSAYEKAVPVFGRDVVRNAERIFQYETFDYQAQCFNDTFSPAFSAMQNDFPYGWNQMAKFWQKNEKYAPVGIQAKHDLRTTNPILIFPSVEAAIFSLCYILTVRKNNPGAYAWRDVALQLPYNEMISQIQPAYTL